MITYLNAYVWGVGVGGGSDESPRGGMKNMWWEVNWREGSGENMRDAPPASCI